MLYRHRPMSSRQPHCRVYRLRTFCLLVFIYLMRDCDEGADEVLEPQLHVKFLQTVADGFEQVDVEVLEDGGGDEKQ